MSFLDQPRKPPFQNPDRIEPDPLQSNRELWDYWHSLPKHDHVPRRTDFDPMRIPGTLPDVAILERTGEDHWLIRLAGTRIGHRVGYEPTGMNYLDIVNPATRGQVSGTLALVSDTPCGYEGIRIIELVGGARIPIQTTMLPLRAADGSVRLLISAHSRLVAPPDGDEAARLADISFFSRRLIDIGAGVPAATKSLSL